MNESSTEVPSGARQVAVKVVESVMGTVAAPPDRVFSEKLPSELVTIHDATPCELQKTEVRAPRGTFAGVAHMSIAGVMPEYTGAGAGGAGVLEACCTYAGVV